MLCHVITMNDSYARYTQHICQCRLLQHVKRLASSRERERERERGIKYSNIVDKVKNNEKSETHFVVAREKSFILLECSQESATRPSDQDNVRVTVLMTVISSGLRQGTRNFDFLN
jgi:hypothetical protein